MNKNEAAQLYAPEFVAATPAGVTTGKNHEGLKQVMADGYARYRAQGKKDMALRRCGFRPSRHSIAGVEWTATYARKKQPDVAIDFNIRYFVRDFNAKPEVFGWVVGDEGALLKQHGAL